MRDNKNWPVIVLLAVLLPACGGEQQPGASDQAEVVATARSAQGNLTIEVAVAAALQPEIAVVSAAASEPGRVNPKEVALLLENRGSSERSVLVSGDWQNASGQSFGGANSVLKIAAGATADFNAGTRNDIATHFRVSVEPTELSKQELQDVALLEAAAGAVQGHGIAYTPLPTLDQVPAWPVRGVANGAVFKSESVMFMPLQSGWKLLIHDRKVDPMQGLAIIRSEYPDVQTVKVNLPREPQPGAVFKRALEYGGGMFQIKPSAQAQGTTSWNTSVAWVIEITSWDKRAWQEGGGTFQRAGSASGRLYICFEGAPDRIQSSFVAGEFSDVPIMYYGPPRL
ncbi:MAG: hypothetical protein ABJ308_11840 [Halieaceae bacterium]